MDIEELVVIYKKEKSWISSRMSTIDKLLDRAAYGNASDEEELTQEYDELEKRLEELSKVENIIDKVKELHRLINMIEDNIDNLACFIGNDTKIENLYKEIDELEKQKNNKLDEIEEILKKGIMSSKFSNKR